jgi:hypothetical protein
MTGKTVAIACVLCSLWTVRAGAQSGSEARQIPSDNEIKAMLADRIEVQRRSVAMVVGITAM